MERLHFSKYVLNFWFLFILFIGMLPLLLFNVSALNDLSSSLLNLNTIFLSILIEALPFVLIGILIAGFIQIFITEEHIQRWIPRNPVMAVIMSCFVGALFPACECGIVPIVRRLIAKGVPIHAAMGFMLTGPLINPIVILSTYMAFGNDLRIASLRMLVGFVIAIVVALLISLFFKGSQFKVSLQSYSLTTTSQQTSFITKLVNMVKHAIDEFLIWANT